MPGTRVKVYRTPAEYQMDRADAERHGWEVGASSEQPDGTLKVWYRDTGARTGEHAYLVPSSLAAIGGVGVALGVFLPWVSMGIVSLSGLDADLWASVALLAIATAIVIAGLLGVQTDRPEWMGIGLAAVLATLLTGAKVVQFREASIELLGTTVEPQVGSGLWLSLIGALLALFAAFTGGRIARGGR